MARESGAAEVHENGPRDPRGNLILDALPDDERTRLLEPSITVRVQAGEVIHEAGETIRHVHFPLTAVASLLQVMEDGATVESTTIGREGMVGLAVFLGGTGSTTRAICQISGDTVRIRADDFLSAVEESPTLRQRVAGHVQAVLAAVAQAVACNRLHSLELRTARWLLMTHDRVGKDEIDLTQEFLAQMLGVRRPSVTVAAGMLQKAGLISYRRGRIVIIDRDGLEAASCECYAVIRDELARLVPPGLGPPSGGRGSA